MQNYAKREQQWNPNHKNKKKQEKYMPKIMSKVDGKFVLGWPKEGLWGRGSKRGSAEPHPGHPRPPTPRGLNQGVASLYGIFFPKSVKVVAYEIKC